MAKLTTYQGTTKKPDQSLWITVEYDPQEKQVTEIISADLYISGKFVADIAPLLLKLDGDPLNVIIEGYINWEEIYQDNKKEVAA